MWITRVRATSVPGEDSASPARADDAASARSGPALSAPSGAGVSASSASPASACSAWSAWSGGTSLLVSSGVISATVASMACERVSGHRLDGLDGLRGPGFEGRDGLDRLAGFCCPGLEAAQGAGLQGIDGFDGFDGLERPGLDHRGLSSARLRVVVTSASGRVPRGWVGAFGPAVLAPVVPPPGDSVGGGCRGLGVGWVRLRCGLGRATAWRRAGPPDRRHDRVGVRVSRGRRRGTQPR